MKKYIFIITALLFTTALSAQERNQTTAEQRAQANATELRQALELDDAQYAKIYKVYLKQARREDKRAEQAKADIMATEKRVNGLLTVEQAERWERMQSSADGVFSPHKGVPGKKVARIREQNLKNNLYIEP